MNGTQTNWTQSAPPISLPARAVDPLWYAIQIRTRLENKAAVQLERKGVETFLPVTREVHRWSDRRQVIELPLFPGYAFVRVSLVTDSRLEVLQTTGVISFVCQAGRAAPVPDKQLEDLRTLQAQKIACATHPFLKAGQRVRIRSGCLEGLEGILVVQKSEQCFVISIDAIQRSLAIRIEDYDLDAL